MPAQSLFSQTYAYDCISDVELLSYMHELHAKSVAGSRQQTVMERMGWLAPILHIAAQAHPQLVQRSLFSPKRACMSLSRIPVNPAKLLALCNTLPDDRPTTQDDLSGIHQALAALPPAVVNPVDTASNSPTPSNPQAILTGVHSVNRSFPRAVFGHSRALTSQPLASRIALAGQVPV